MFYQNEPELTELTCPISGRPLWNFGSDWNSLDGPTIFGTEDKEFLYEKWPRVMDFQLYVKVVNGKPYDAKFPYRTRIFELDAVTSRFGSTCITVWKEYYEVYGELIPADDPEFEGKAEAIKTRWQEECDKKNNNSIALPFILSKTIANELISVQPMSAPAGSSFYLDYRFKERKR